MLVARDVEVRAGARLLLEHASFQVAAGDRIGLVGRNGAGKTTLTKILSGESQPASGTITRTGAVGYLPQDPRTGDLDVLAKNRILSARGLDAVVDRLRRAELAMGDDSADVRDQAMGSYARAEAELAAAGGYAAEAEAARIASNLGLPERVLHQPIGTLSGGQRRRVELARILFSGAPTLLLDEPTNHLDADSIVWLRDFLAGHSGGLLVITHDVGLLERCVNKVFHLDANRAELDVYTMGWKRYLQQRETDEKRRRRERLNAERKADQLFSQADKMRAKATKAMAAHNMVRRAERLLAGIDGERATDRVAKINQVSGTGTVRKDATDRGGPQQELRITRGLHRHRSRHRQGQPGCRSGAQRCRQDNVAAHPGWSGRTRYRRGGGWSRSAHWLLRTRA